MTRKRQLVLAAVVLAVTGAGGWGYALLGSIWPPGPVAMQLQLSPGGPVINGTLSDGAPSWDAAAAAAFSIWNANISTVQFTTVAGSTAAIGDGNGVNNVFFDTDVFGFAFDGALAITTEWIQDGSQRVEGDVIFNANLRWDSYRGSQRRSPDGETVYDFRRVALHEFGHVLGLDHPDDARQSVRAIMNSRVSDLDALQGDDIAGAQVLYGIGPGEPAPTPPEGAATPEPAPTSVPLPVASFSRPAAARIVTGAESFVFRGKADPLTVRRVSLTNSRRGASKFFGASGIENWSRKNRLYIGMNVIRLYVTGSDGSRVEVARRIVIRRP